MKKLEVEQGGVETSVKITCGCGGVIKVTDESQRRMQMAMRCLDIHFGGNFRHFSF